MKVGFIGLGAMGRPMAVALCAAEHELRVCDTRRHVADALLASGAFWVDSPAEAAEGAEVVFTCLPGPAEVYEVALAEDGLLEAMESGSAWFDLSTNAPAHVRGLGAKFAVRGVHMLDAPVSGGPKGAREGQLTFWVGGEKSVFEQFVSLLRTMGGEPMYLGPLGAGSVAKIVHNCANFTVQNALAEVFTLGVKAGICPDLLFKALRQGTAGRSRTFDRLAEQFLPGKYDPPAMPLRLALKDMGIAIDLARECGVEMRSARITLNDMTEAMERGWGDRDARISMSLHEERAGVSVRVPPAQLAEILR